MASFPFKSLITFVLGVGLLVEAVLAHSDPPRYLGWVTRRSIRLTRHTDETKLFYGRYVYPLIGLALIVMAMLSLFNLI